MTAQTRAPSVNVFCKDYEYGLRHSRALIASVLETNGFGVRQFSSSEVMKWTRSEIERMIATPRDFNLYIEGFYTGTFGLARQQLLIPNQECFPREHASYLRAIDVVVCKTFHAVQIFTQLGLRTAYTSFTSRDCRLPQAEPMRPEFLCLGARQNSVAGRVMNLWTRHPEWPRLTIACDASIPDVDAANVRQIRGFLSDDETLRLQNEHRFHLCVSRAEGFGHKLNEGMSCGAIVITTDAPPMNELVGTDRGMLVRFARTEPLGLGTAFDFDESDLASTIERCLALSAEEIERRSLRARRWFEENDRLFRDRFPKVLLTLA